MKKGLKYFLFIAAVGSAAALAAIARQNARERLRQVTCSSLEVEIRDGFSFVTPGDVQKWLDERYGAYIGQRIDSVDLTRVEKILDAQGAVKKSEAWMTTDGRMNVRVTQRRPVARFQKGDSGFYMDGSGFIFPLQEEGYTERIPVIDGEIPIKADRESLEAILGLVRFISSSPTWNGNIVQINVDSQGDLTLIPGKGRERFLIGKPTDLKSKFARMEDYYRCIVPEKGEDYYRTVNVKYNGQIICRR